MKPFKDIVMKTETEQKEEEYNNYIVEHTRNVFTVYTRLKKYIENQSVEFKNELFHNIDEHDDSKWNDLEFYGYRQYFYPCKNEIKCQKTFDKSWLNHIHSNPHHWEYWAIPGVNKAIEIPFIYILEMMCDWTAMSIKFNNYPSNWYSQNKDKMIIHENSKLIIDSWLKIFDNIYEELKNE